MRLLGIWNEPCEMLCKYMPPLGDGMEIEMENEIMVSVICNAYNHEPYIAEALQSFVDQKTNFRFEVIVHDDASTDGTAHIIREYAEKYPDIIKPILEIENQHSKGKAITFGIDLPVTKGKYIAICEGDDFWTDVNKLQKQFDMMESDPEISLCCHANNRIVASTKKQINVMRSIIGQNGFIDYRDLLSESNFPHLSSMMLKRSDYVNLPDTFRGLPVGDYPLRAYLLSLGKIYYFDDVMSSYRVMSQSSWSKEYRFKMDYRYNANKKMDNFLLMYDEHTAHKYHDYIKDLIERKDFVTAVFTGHYAEAKESPLYAKSGAAKKMLINIGIRHPKVAMKLGQMYSIVKNKIRP